MVETRLTLGRRSTLQWSASTETVGGPVCASWS